MIKPALIPALILAVLLAMAPGIAPAQARPGVPRVGVLSFIATPTAARPDPTEAAFHQGLREAGYVEGENIVIERRYADGDPDKLAAMAAELVRLKVDAIVTGGQPPREAARKATTTIPIVTLSGSDPVREGWAASLARPGGNVTGLTFTFPEVNLKRLDLLKEAMPGLTRVAVMIDPVDVVDSKEVIAEAQAAARRLGVQLQVLDVHGIADHASAFEHARRGRAQAMLTVAVFPRRASLAALGARDRLPLVGETSLEAQAGFLLAYGADLDDLVRRSALQVGKILKGARVGELPIERPTKFRLTINLRTARELAIAIPQSMLLRADEVIE